MASCHDRVSIFTRYYNGKRDSCLENIQVNSMPSRKHCGAMGAIALSLYTLWVFVIVEVRHIVPQFIG